MVLSMVMFCVKHKIGNHQIMKISKLKVDSIVPTAIWRSPGRTIYLSVYSPGIIIDNKHKQQWTTVMAFPLIHFFSLPTDGHLL